MMVDEIKGQEVVMERNKVGNISKVEKEDKSVLIVDTGGGMNCTITKRAFHISDVYENHKTSLTGYQDKSGPKLCSIVNGYTKVYVKGRDDPVIFKINYATLVEDKDELESLLVPFPLMSHGIQCDMTPTKYGGKGGIKVLEEFFHLNLMMKNCSL